MPLSKITTASISTAAATSNTSIDNGTLFVDVTNDVVAIGTTTPSTTGGKSLVVYDSSTPRIRLTNSSTGQAAGDGAEFSLSNSDLYIENREAANMHLYLNGATRLKIDSSGRTTLPYQPSFHAGNNNGGGYIGTTSSSPFVFNVTRHNVGSHFNTSTYRFTAPITALYLLYYSFFFEGGSGIQNDTCLFVNGSALNSGSGTIDLVGSRPGTNRITIGYSVAVYLTASDYVDVRGRDSNGTGNSIFGPHSCFGGYLLG